MADRVIVDTSVWVDFFHRQESWLTKQLRELLKRDLAATGDYIIHEVLRGVRSEPQLLVVRGMMASLPSGTMLGDLHAVRSAMRYRELRRKGVTVRKANDAIIANYCIEERLPLRTADRDFEPYAEHMGLRLVRQ